MAGWLGGWVAGWLESVRKNAPAPRLTTAMLPQMLSAFTSAVSAWAGSAHTAWAVTLQCRAPNSDTTANRWRPDRPSSTRATRISWRLPECFMLLPQTLLLCSTLVVLNVLLLPPLAASCVTLELVEPVLDCRHQ